MTDLKPLEKLGCRHRVDGNTETRFAAGMALLPPGSRPVHFLLPNFYFIKAKKNKLKDNYRHLVKWYQYCVAENEKSSKMLGQLLSKLDRDVEADPEYEKDLDDLESLKLIYETALRRHESLVDRYQTKLDSSSSGS